MALKTDPIDLALDTLTGDITVGADLTFSTGIAAVAQSIETRIKTFVGEWFLDLDTGVDYYGKILGKKFNEIQVRNAFRSVIQNTPGVTSIISLTASFDGPTRVCTVNWRTETIFGDSEGSTTIGV